MSGSAMFTIVESSTTMSWQDRITARTRPGCPWGSSRRRGRAGAVPRRESWGCALVSVGSRVVWTDTGISLCGAEWYLEVKRTLPPVTIRRVPPLTIRRVSPIGKWVCAEEHAMSTDVTEVGQAKPLRADARRNRDALLVVAASHFAEQGVEAPLEEIARRAGVGIGTLYRHFPTRDALIADVYRREVDLLCAGVDELLATLPADEALAEWMRSEERRV